MSQFSEESLKPLGHQQLTTTLSAAVGLTVPANAIANGVTKAGARLALIRCETTSVRWRDDGTAPTTSVGMLLDVGETLWYNGDIQLLRFIRTAAGAVLDVAYYR